MIKLRYGYLFIGIVMGLIILRSAWATLPDGRLHITMCNVGQGDSAYLRFPDGRDMLIDGGPDSKVLLCLSKVMPFWDRHLDAVVLTHPEQDHFKGLVDVFQRYRVGVFVHSECANASASYQDFMRLVSQKKTQIRLVTAQDELHLGPVAVSVLWPTSSYIASRKRYLSAAPSVLGIATDTDLNNYSVVLRIRYIFFDAIFTGDSDATIGSDYLGTVSVPDDIEFLKVPHHGSATGMTSEYLQSLRVKNAFISSGKNNRYGHPAMNILSMLAENDINVYRTDQKGDIHVVTDGKTCTIRSEK